MMISDPIQLAEIQNFLTEKRSERGIIVSRVSVDYDDCANNRKHYYKVYYGKITDHDELVRLSIAMRLNYTDFHTFLNLFDVQLNTKYERNRAINDYIKDTDPIERDVDTLNEILKKSKLKILSVR
ncbi:MAG: hypothetical protein J6Z43_06585 [Clostridiales bacterium]|nr:hypothetical protein [Clostridiales bacterium]